MGLIGEREGGASSWHGQAGTISWPSMSHLHLTAVERKRGRYKVKGNGVNWEQHGYKHLWRRVFKTLAKSILESHDITGQTTRIDGARWLPRGWFQYWCLVEINPLQSVVFVAVGRSKGQLCLTLFLWIWIILLWQSAVCLFLPSLPKSAPSHLSTGPGRILRHQFHFSTCTVLGRQLQSWAGSHLTNEPLHQQKNMTSVKIRKFFCI